jgi:histidine triad (HIT) family protein
MKIKTMHNHAPEGYVCPFCMVICGDEGEVTYTKQSAVVYRDEKITAFIASHWWPKNPGHVLIIPNEHFENIYDLPDDLSDAIHRFAKKVSIAFKEVYGAEGVSTRQHNEPAGSQEVWHYHLNIFPRYAGDDFYVRYPENRKTSLEERAPYAKRLREYFEAVE